jgi:hypothetical protein
MGHIGNYGICTLYVPYLYYMCTLGVQYVLGIMYYEKSVLYG